MKKIVFLTLIFYLGLCSGVFAADIDELDKYSAAMKIELVKTAQRRYKAKLYLLNYDDLISSGIVPSNVDPRTIRLLSQGQEIPIYVHGEEDGSLGINDYILFYGQAHLESRFTYRNVYWLVWGQDKGERLAQISTEESSDIAKLMYEHHYELNQKTQPKNITADPWFFKKGLSTRNHSASETYVNVELYESLPYKLENPELSASVEFGFYGSSTYPGLFEVDYLLKINDVEIGESLTQWKKRGYHSAKINGIEAELDKDLNSVKINFVHHYSPRYYYMTIDYLKFSYQIASKMLSEDMKFTLAGNGSKKISLADFSYDNAFILAMNNNSPLELVKNYKLESNYLSFSYLANSNTSFIVGSEEIAKENREKDLLIKKLDLSGKLTNSQGAKYIIIRWQEDLDYYLSPAQQSLLASEDLRALMSSHKDYVEAIDPLLDQFVEYRQESGLSVLVAGTNQIYNNYNGGIDNPQAIKDFLEDAYRNWSVKPKYVLFLGDADTDFREDMVYDYFEKPYEFKGSESYRQVPTHVFYNNDIINNSEFGYALSDEWFACFGGEDDVLPELYVGRFPISPEKADAVTQLSTMIQKTISYETAEADEDWVQRMLLISGGSIEFEKTTELIESIVEGKEVIRLSPPPLNLDVIGRLNNGAFLVHYSGHGSFDKWAIVLPELFQWFGDAWNIDIPGYTSRILDIDKAKNLNNKNKYGIYTALSCINSYISPVINKVLNIQESLAEALIREEDAGAVAVFASSGVTFPDFQRYMSEGFYDAIFERGYRVLGEVVHSSKLYLSVHVDSFASDAARSFMLLGDPALQIPMAARPEPPIPPVGPPEDLTIKPIVGAGFGPAGSPPTWLWETVASDLDLRDKEAAETVANLAKHGQAQFEFLKSEKSDELLEEESLAESRKQNVSKLRKNALKRKRADFFKNRLSKSSTKKLKIKSYESQEKKNLFQRVLGFIKSIFSRIFNFLKGLF